MDDIKVGVVRATYEIITEESAAEGDVSERGWLCLKTGERIPVEDAQSNPNLIPRKYMSLDDVVELLQGCEPSSSYFHVGVWYTMYGEQDPLSGDYENISYHLHDNRLHMSGKTICEWSEEEQRAIYQAVKGK